MSGIDDMIATLKRFENAPREVAKIAAPLVDAAVKKTARAGTTPDGDPWKPRKDGGAPLVHSADALSTKATGGMVTVTLEGVEVIHNYGDHRNPKRQILPDGGAGIPEPVAEALTKAAGIFFDRATGGGP